MGVQALTLGVLHDQVDELGSVDRLVELDDSAMIKLA